jgi:hypothetical protein
LRKARLRSASRCCRPGSGMRMRLVRRLPIWGRQGEQGGRDCWPGRRQRLCSSCHRYLLRQSLPHHTCSNRATAAAAAAAQRCMHRPPPDKSAQAHHTTDTTPRTHAQQHPKHTDTQRLKQAYLRSASSTCSGWFVAPSSITRGAGPAPHPLARPSICGNATQRRKPQRLRLSGTGAVGTSALQPGRAAAADAQAYSHIPAAPMQGMLARRAGQQAEAAARLRQQLCLGAAGSLVLARRAALAANTNSGGV